MKATTILLIAAICISYGVADANWLHDIVKGVSEGIHDAYEKGKTETKYVKEKLEKKFVLHPKMKNLEKKGKFIDKFLKFIEKKKAKEGELEDFNNLKFFTKIDDDGDEKNDVPFVPKDLLRKDSIFGEKGKKKAEYIFKHLAKMWKEKSKASPVDKHEENKESDNVHTVSPRILTVKSVPKSFNAESEKEPDQNSKEDVKKFNVLGKDEKEIIPDFVVDDFKKQKKYFGKDAKKIIPDYVVNDFKSQQSSKDADKLKKLHKVDVLGEDEEKIMPDFVKREFQIMNKKEMEMLKKKKKVFTGDEELAIQLLGEADKERAMQLIHKDQVKKDINKESEELEKTVEELIPFLGSKDKGQGNAKEEAKSEKKEEEKEVEVMGTKEKFMKEKDEQFKQSEKKILEEEKAFEEAEKKWEEEIRKKTLEEIKKAEEQKMKKTTQQEEIEEELHETADNTFTPPDEEATPTEPTISDEQVKPHFTFNFDEKKEESVKKVPEEEEIFSVPRRIEEPASLFQRRKEPESAFEEMSDEVKPFFEKLDDAKYRKKFLEEEKQWMKIKKWALSRFFKNKNGRWRKNAEE